MTEKQKPAETSAEDTSEKSPVEKQTASDGKSPHEDDAAGQTTPTEKVEEIDGRDGPDPTRYGDWERKGILSDF